MIGRATQGVRLVNLDEGDEVMDVARVIADDEDEIAEGEVAEGEVSDGDEGGEGEADDEAPEA